MHPVVPEPIRPYFRDVHDHLLREMARVIELRELLTSILTANMTQASFRQNEDVRKISAWAAIIAVPTADRRDLRDELRAHARARVGGSATRSCSC